jgi:hypothetical protein
MKTFVRKKAKKHKAAVRMCIKEGINLARWKK